MAQLSNADFYKKWVPLFADNDFQNIDGSRLALFLADLRDTFPSLAGLNVRQVKGAPYPVPYTDSLATIPPAYRILGMSAVARNGQTAAAAKTQLPQPPVTYQLVANAGGAIAALVDEQPGTVATTPALWVQVSGQAQQIVDSFPALVLKNADGSPHPYNAGDKVKYLFASGQARLFEVRAYLNVPSNPLPTGLDSDPNYRPFAPLVEAAAAPALTAAAVPGATATRAAFRLGAAAQALAQAGRLRMILTPIAAGASPGAPATTPDSNASTTPDANGYSTAGGWSGYGQGWPQGY